MLKIKTNSLSEKGVLRGHVRSAVAENVKGLTLALANGTEVALDSCGAGVYYGQIATDENGVAIYAKVNLAITANEYREPTPKAPKEKEPVVIDIE